MDASRAGLSRAFHLFWAGQSLSAVGDAMTLVAMPLLVFAATGSVEDMGRLTSVVRTGALLATAAGGFVIDRGDPRRIMIRCDLVRFGLMALLPLAWHLVSRSMLLVYVVGLCGAFAHGIFYVGHVSLIPQLVGRDHVTAANSRIEATAALALVVGPFFSGLLSARGGPEGAIGVDALTFAASAVTLILVGETRSVRRPASPRTGDWFAGLRFLRAHRELWRLTLLVGGYQFFTAAIVDLLIYRLKHELGQNDVGTGILFAIASAVAVAAAAATPALRKRLPLFGIWIPVVAAQGVTLLVTCTSRSFPILVVTAALFMSGLTTLVICQASFRQEVTPAPLLGRVTSAYSALAALPAPFGAIAATTLAARVGAEKTQAAIGAGVLFVACAAIVGRLGDRHTP